MTHNIFIAGELIGSLILIGAYGKYRRGPAAPWANRTLFCAAICGLGYALIGVVRFWYSFGLSKTTIAALTIAGHGVGGVGAGLIIGLMFSGQLWKIGSRPSKEETK